MKPPIPRISRHERRGFALVIVLAFMAILIAVVVGFLTRATTERKAASGFGSSVSSRQLADTAITLVQAQINLATNQGNTVAWASQPGMVRTYNNTDGGLIQAFKLYSAKDMITTAVNLTEDLPPASWSTDVANWTDLNSPVTVSGVKTYPIMDPTGAGTIAGFSIAGSAPTTVNQTAPMPVRWLYQLQDGSLVSPTGTGKTATVAGETATNPIVGRVGFWTDDETCKVNINTAAGDEDPSIISPRTAPGSAWDTPRYASIPEQTFYSDRIPLQNEYQRFPGHPATVYLSKIFRNLTRSQISAIAPRITDGGSSGGTKDTRSNPASMPVENGGRGDRLYTSVDELMFDPSRTENIGLSKTQIEQARFFLTAQSKAPEVNLFNMPRISMWPIDNRGEDFLTTYDKVLRQCTTLNFLDPLLSNRQPYYFKRSDSQSPTTDAALNPTLFSYLDSLTTRDIPGFGGRFSNKYPTARQQILVEMLDYIRCTNLYDTNLVDKTKRYTLEAQKANAAPLRMNNLNGFGRFFSLSEAGLIFTNEAEKTLIPPASTATVKQKAARSAVSGYPAVPAGPDPTMLKNNEKIIQVAWLMEPFCVAAGYTTISANTTWTVEGLESLAVENSDGIFVPAFDAGVRQQSITRIMNQAGSGLAKAGDLGNAQGSVGDLRNFVNYPIDSSKPYPFLGRQITILGDSFRFSGGTVTIKIYAGTNVSSSNLVQTISLNFPSSTGAGLAFPVASSVGFPSPRFEGTEVLLAERLKKIVPAAGAPTGSVKPQQYVAARDITLLEQNWQWISPWDTVRSVVMKSGDAREIAIQTEIKPADYDKYFTKITNFDAGFSGSANATLNSTSDSQKGFRMGHSYQFGNHETMYGSNISYIVTYGSSGIYPVPKISKTNPVTPMITTGDFDTGVAILNDGAYINKPDEGILASNDVYNNYFADYNPGDLDASYFSPNRMIPSPGMFGSLPVGVPWRTLLFRNQPNHPSISPNTPKDYLLMDLFWMPIVQPYAISEPFSTSGKINLNYQILPFTYINRSTAFEAALAGEKVLSLPASISNGYKTYENSTRTTTDYRNPVNATALVQTLNSTFNSGEIFKSPAQICDFDLDKTPADYEPSSTGFDLTGDNVRERPYTNIYQKLTTKSNTYTVHFRVQALKKLTNSTPATWTENKDVVLAEYRGSTTVERFIDANNTSIPNYLSDPNNSNTLDKFYRWRIVANRQFAP